MSDNPLVSVGIPVCGHPEGLLNTLQNIVGQSYTNLEITVSINPSPDENTDREMISVVSRFQTDPRLRWYCQPTNIGLANNFQFVLLKATGSYFVWAADDDQWGRRFVETLVGALQSNPESNEAMCTTIRIDPDGRSIGFVNLSIPPSPIMSALYFACHLRMAYFFHGIFRTDQLRMYMKERQDIFFGGDWFTVTEMIMSGSLVWVDIPLFMKGINPEKDNRIFNLDKLCWLKLCGNFPMYLLKSKNVPTRRKIWIPLMAGLTFIWVAKLYVGHLVWKITR